MPDRLEFKAGPARGGRSKLEVARVTEAGQVMSRSIQYFDADHHYAAAARLLGLGVTELAALIERHRATGEAAVELCAPEPAAAAPQPPKYRVRGRLQRAGEAAVFEDFDSALAAPCAAEDPVIEWEGTDATCVLDLDFHAGLAPDPADLRAEAELLEPRPPLWWRSRSGGLHALYHALEAYTAEELAAVASLRLLARFPAATVELKSRTRRPEELTRQQATADAGYVRRLAGRAEADPASVADWLEDRGFVHGERYPHDRCPVSPSPRAAGNSPPVCIYEDHVFCHICAADGVRRGSRTAGYFPYSRLCGDAAPTVLRACVENITHWGHARYVMAALVANEVLAKSAYRAALRQRHGDDPRVPLAFAAGGDVGLVRFDGYWATGVGEALKLDRASPILAALPAAKYVDEEGQVKVSPERMEWLSQSCDLAPIGYPAMIPVWGIQLTRDQDLPSHKTFVVMNTETFRAAGMEARRPRYLPAGRRMGEDEAWARIERAYPRVSRNIIKLLIAAKGCSEHRAGLPPMIFLTGPTGSGKSGSPLLAAAICGDQVTGVQFSTQPERVRQYLSEAKKKGSFAGFDEYIKQARAGKLTPDAAMEIMLGFTADSVSHMLYVGPVRLGEPPVCFWADTVIPQEVQTHAQVGRRMHHVPQREELAWEAALVAAGIDGPQGLRHGPMEFCDAANAILSCVIDEFFPPGPATDFAAVAAALGFKKLRDTDLAVERAAVIRRLFQLVCAAPPLSGPELKRWPGEGWRLIAGDDELAQTWRSLADAADQGYSRAVAEVDLRKVLGLRCHAELDRRQHGNRVVIRFINHEKGLTNAALVLEPEPRRPDGRGDAVPGGPEDDRFPGLPEGYDDPPAECRLPD